MIAQGPPTGWMDMYVPVLSAVYAALMIAATSVGVQVRYRRKPEGGS